MRLEFLRPIVRGLPRAVFRAAAASLLLAFALCPAWSKPPAPAKPAPVAANPKPAEPGARTSTSGQPRVDSAKVHRLYLDGDFDAAIAILEDDLKETRQYRHEDSVFIFKHLGVMYAAQYETREKGKYYMHKLLTVEPTAKIMDMYASDMIYMIFKNIQEEYEQNRAVLADARRNSARADSLPARDRRPEPAEGRPASGRTGEESASSGNRKWVWAGVGVAALAAGVGAYLLFSGDPQVTVKEKEVRF